MSTFLESDRLALLDAAVLPGLQADELRDIRAHVAAGLPVDETCARWVDRYQDEIDRRAAGMPLPDALAGHMQVRYGCTGPKAGAR